MNKEEKRQMFLEMQEHPEKYSDRQAEELLADEDIRLFVQDMAMVKWAMKKKHPHEVDIDEAWRQFQSVQQTGQRIRVKTAASVVGVLLLSGVAFAAVWQWGGWSKDNPGGVPQERQSVETSMQADNIRKTETMPSDTSDVAPVVFENVKLSEILSQMAAFHHAKVQFHSEAVHRIRLYFRWEKQKSLQQNINLLNGFDAINITYSVSDNLISVE
ncbi:MAG: DUF4974 domain-containing protein [Prevotellaceae bacterium]|nr:DUF4974 domain-containing protein [Prevotellaceae bacterium]MDY6131195.1 DUF4974 domain-containing protein [Prevotella sp.]